MQCLQLQVGVDGLVSYNICKRPLTREIFTKDCNTVYVGFCLHVVARIYISLLYELTNNIVTKLIIQLVNNS